MALISHVPGGLGVFESMILLSAPGIPADALLGSMLIYRGIYYLLPLTLAALLLGGNELLQKKSLIQTGCTTWRGAGGVPWFPSCWRRPPWSAARCCSSPAPPRQSPGRLHWLQDFLPLPVIELSHFLGSLVGVCLLLLARGLQRRLDAAYVLAAILLGAGSLLSLLKGADYEEALLLGLMLAGAAPLPPPFSTAGRRCSVNPSAPAGS